MVTHRPAVLELVQRIVVVDAGKVVMDGPKAQVLAALSGAKPAAQAAPVAANGAAAAPTNVHRHPSTQPAESRAAVWSAIIQAPMAPRTGCDRAHNAAAR